MAIKVTGRWFDVLKWKDGRKEFGQHGEFEWGYNQIQNVFAKLLAGLCQGEATYSRIAYVGIGHGDVSWDTVPPTKDHDQATLEDEFFRKAIPQVDIVFLDPITNLPVAYPTRKLEIVYLLESGEANGTLREFGLFGGDATVSINSGQIVNWISHARIDKDSSLEIQRKVRLEFATL